MKDLKFKSLAAALVMAISVCLPAYAQDKLFQTLFTNVNVFDGVNEARIENANVLVEGNLIKSVSAGPD